MKNNDISEKDLLSLNIAELTKKQETIISNDKTKVSCDWEAFISLIKLLSENKPERKRTYLIDEEIIDCFKICNIENATTTTIINSILRAFIIQNKEKLQTCLRPRPNLI